MTEHRADHRRSPVPARDQDSPPPERPLNAQEEAGQSMQELDEPPQAEGDRESTER